MSDAEDTRSIVNELRRQGWEVEISGRDNKWKAKPPDPGREMVVFSSKPGNLTQVIRYLRQNGFVWPPKPDNGHVVPARISSTPFAPSPSPDVQVTALAEYNGASPVTELTAVVVNDDSYVDRLFREIKEAKEYARMAVEHLAECETERDAAEMSVGAAMTERDRAVEEYRQKKLELDHALDPFPDPIPALTPAQAHRRATTFGRVS